MHDFAFPKDERPSFTAPPEAAALRAAGVDIQHNATPIAAKGKRRVTGLRFAVGNGSESERTVACDLVALAPRPEAVLSLLGQDGVRPRWDDRIGASRVQARNWRLMAFGCLILSAGFASALVWQSARGTVVPWVVEVDHSGEATAVAPAVADYQPTDPQIAFHLARFVEGVRSLPDDPIVVRQNWLRAYDFTTSAGATALNDYARAADPFTRVGTQQVAVDVSSVIRASPDSFRVAWTERHYQNGQLAGTERWTAILTIVIQTPHDADQLRRNPLGVFVNAINWSRELGQ